jgi:hypothetical protein
MNGLSSYPFNYWLAGCNNHGLFFIYKPRYTSQVATRIISKIGNLTSLIRTYLVRIDILNTNCCLVCLVWGRRRNARLSIAILLLLRLGADSIHVPCLLTAAHVETKAIIAFVLAGRNVAIDLAIRPRMVRDIAIVAAERSSQPSALLLSSSATASAAHTLSVDSIDCVDVGIGRHGMSLGRTSWSSPIGSISSTPAPEGAIISSGAIAVAAAAGAAGITSDTAACSATRSASAVATVLTITAGQVSTIRTPWISRSGVHCVYMDISPIRTRLLRARRWLLTVNRVYRPPPGWNMFKGSRFDPSGFLQNYSSQRRLGMVLALNQRLVSNSLAQIEPFLQDVRLSRVFVLGDHCLEQEGIERPN